jgi:hypothetical protein
MKSTSTTRFPFLCSSRLRSGFAIGALTSLAFSLTLPAADPFAENVRTTDPLTPEQQQKTFHLPPGFEIQLVAAEPDINKPMNMAFDAKGRLWVTTSREYPFPAPLDKPGRDRIMIFEDFGPDGRARKVTQFADGLNIPIGIYPYGDGAIVWSIPNIWFLHDTDGDGKADQRKVILTGFGVQDSHLFPHQFTRAPGNWIWMAQGAFNYGKVRTTKGSEVKFDQTRMARFRYDGSDFDITSQGPCNIWGLVLTSEGEAWIQEANDYGYPVMPFHAYANYPGCSDAQFKSYAPEFPGTAPDFQMGGTGLSGLALSDIPDHVSRITHHVSRITLHNCAFLISRYDPSGPGTAPRIIRRLFSVSTAATRRFLTVMRTLPI